MEIETKMLSKNTLSIYFYNWAIFATYYIYKNFHILIPLSLNVCSSIARWTPRHVVNVEWVNSIKHDLCSHAGHWSCCLGSSWHSSNRVFLFLSNICPSADVWSPATVPLLSESFKSNSRCVRHKYTQPVCTESMLAFVLCQVVKPCNSWIKPHGTLW